jgi:putative transposase
MGKTKGGLNTKIAAAVDAIGQVVGLHIMPGNAPDLDACEVFFDKLRGRWVLADKAFDCDELRQKLAKAGCRVHIPPRSNRKIQYYYDKELYKLRHVIENFFYRIKYYKRVFTPV